MRRGCRVTLFGEPKGPVRDNVDEAQTDAIRLKLGQIDAWGNFFLDAEADLEWVVIEARSEAA